METFTRTVWQWPMSGGQIVAMLDRTAAALVQTYWWLVDQVKVAPAVFHDTTSWWVDGRRAVFWVFTTRRETVYWIDPSGAGRKLGPSNGLDCYRARTTPTPALRLLP